MSRPLRILYAAGPGDVIGTYRHWKQGHDDPASVALTYSGQFYDVCRELGAQACVIATRRPPDTLVDDALRIEHRPATWANRAGLLYHLGRCWDTARLTLRTIRFRADVLLVSQGDPWFLLAPLAVLRTRIVPTLHCAPWPAGYRPHGLKARLIQWLDGWFWRHAAAATICVSPECERQVRQLAGTCRGPIHQARAQYRPGTLAELPPPALDSAPPYRVLYAGRLERAKGVLDLPAVAESLQRQAPGRYIFEVCGEGPARQELAGAARARHLEPSFLLRGQLDQPGMLDALRRAHVVIVPTTRAFAEGLNKVSVEAVLAGRPVVTSRLSNALEVLGEAVLEVPPDDVEAYVQALRRLFEEPGLYQRKCQACRGAAPPFYDPGQSWAAALQRILLELQPQTDGSAHLQLQGDR